MLAVCLILSSFMSQQEQDSQVLLVFLLKSICSLQ